MRIAPLILLVLFPTQVPAGFSVICSSVETTSIYQAAVESCTTANEELTPRELQESLVHTVAKLNHDNVDIVDGTLSVLSFQTTAQPASVPVSCCNMHFKLTTIPDKTLGPDELRLDILFDVNGVDMGGLGSVSGIPTGNGRQGIVRIDGSGEQLAHHFGPQPHISLAVSGPSSADFEVTLAQELACLIFIAAACLSAMRHRQHQERQLELQRRRLRNLQQAQADLNKSPV